MKRTEERLPNIYLEESRDFQLLVRLLSGINTAKYKNAKGILNVLDPMQCPEQYLDLLRDRLGFEPRIGIEPDDMRIVLKAFPYLIRNKGSMKAIDSATRLALLLQGVDPKLVEIHVKEDIANIRIYYNKEIDTRLLGEIFRHIAPAGFTFEVSLAEMEEYGSTIGGDSVVFIGRARTETLSSVQDNIEANENNNLWGVATLGVQESVGEYEESITPEEGTIIEEAQIGQDIGEEI